MDMPDNIHNWMANFFNGHSHATKFGDITSVFRNITASVIQGCGIGPASYVVNAADLITLLANNILLKYADDTYLIVPAVNLASCAAELQHIEDWAQKNNLQLNRKKTACIIFTNPDSRQSVKVPEQIVPDIDIVDSLNILGVTVTRNLTMSVHVNKVLSSCAQTLFALRTLRAHGMPYPALQTIFRSKVVSKLLYASPAWCGFTRAEDRIKIDSFISRSKKFLFCSDSLPQFEELCAQADDQLFKTVINNCTHVLHKLLPERKISNYSLRERRHNFILPKRSSRLVDKNFFIRTLYKLSY
jgi:hypothetical protein